MNTITRERIPSQAHLQLPRRACAAVGAAALLSMLAVTAGCVVAVRPAPAGVVYTAEPGEVVVDAEPPAPIVEAIGIAPGPGYFWIGGYYHWYGNRWGWVRGHYELPPRRGAVWVAPRYDFRGGRRVYVRGFWR
ncbi:MAG TPA: hypothetical protein VN775_00370 [Opitutaceae bacterium]|nr:hypothetical protein [Opitutaceae bacterium]